MYAISLAIVSFVIFLLFPMLGIPGRVDELRFELGLSVGMTYDETLQLRHEVGGDDIRAKPTKANYNDPRGILYVWFMKGGFICIAGGDLYQIIFDAKKRVRSWTVEPWIDGC